VFDCSFLPQAQFEFVVVSDTHYMLDPGPQAVEFESRRRQTARAERALSLIASLDPPLVIHLGDLVQEYPETLRHKQAMAEAHEQLQRCGVRPRHVAGNQDIGDKPDPTMPTQWVTSESLAAFHAWCGPSWYSWDQGSIHFVVLNSQILNTALPEAVEQQGWLEADLQTHRGRRIFLFLHLSPFLKHEHEPALGHYDNIAEPARSWLLNLLRQYRVELLFSGHSHFFFFNRLGQTRCLVTPSTSFTRPGFSQALSSGPPPEQGRDDAKKLGFYLVRLQEDAPRVHFVRTYGHTDPLDKTTPERPLITRAPRDLPHSPLGLVMRHPLAPAAEVPLAWPSVVRQPVRNDYPFLACLELGLQHLRAPAADLADPLQGERLAFLRDEGIQLTATWFWSEGHDFLKAVRTHRDQLDGVELQLPGGLWPDEACLRQARQCRTELARPVSLSAVIPRERVPGKQHLRTRLGYRLAELTELNAHLARHDARIDRVLCRVDPMASPWNTMTQALETQPLSHLGAIDWVVEFATTDEQTQIIRAAEALFAAALFPQSRLFLEPLVDLDRTMDITHGLLDRMGNPRPVFNVVRCLNTILFASTERRQPLAGPDPEGSRVLGLVSATTTWWLLLPWPAVGEKRQLDLANLPGFEENRADIRCFHLVQGTSQPLTLAGNQSSVKTFKFDEATLLMLPQNSNP
jgi:predicted phosphodiesterase